MKKQFEILKKHKINKDRAAFNKVITTLWPNLRKYIDLRLHIYEAKGWLPKNFYQPEDILADVYLNAFKEFERIPNPEELKVRLYTWADQIIGDYAVKENKIPDTKKLPVAQLVQEELKSMDEKLSATADGEPILVSDLQDDDISYEQDEFKPKIYLFDYDSQNAFVQSLGLTADDFRDEKLRSFFGNIYSQLPETIRRILDLNALGGLTYNEIAEIVGIQPDEVEKVVIAVKDKFFGSL